MIWKSCSFSATCLPTQRPKSVRTYPVIALHEHLLIFYVLELYSTNQIHIYARPGIIHYSWLISSGKFTMYHQLLVFLRMSRNGKNISMVVKQKVSHFHPVAVEWTSLVAARSIASKLSRAKFQRNKIKYFLRREITRKRVPSRHRSCHLLKNSSKYLRSCKILQI